jgi:hypothetical protein
MAEAELSPQGGAIKPGTPQLPQLYGVAPAPVEQAVGAILAELQEGRKTSFMDMVPPACQPIVRRMAADAYPTRGQGMPLQDFEDAMAWNWLAKLELYRRMKRASGFDSVSELPKNAKTPIIAITTSASIIVASEPKGPGTRSIGYLRIPLRDDIDIPPQHQGELLDDLHVDERLKATRIDSSPLMGILAHPKTGTNHEKTWSNLAESYTAVDRMTICGQHITVLQPRRKP